MYNALVESYDWTALFIWKLVTFAIEYPNEIAVVDGLPYLLILLIIQVNKLTIFEIEMIKRIATSLPPAVIYFTDLIIEVISLSTCF